MDYAKLTNGELDNIMATEVMGWHLWIGLDWMDAKYQVVSSIKHWRPSSGKALNKAANQVLLKVLAKRDRIIMEALLLLNGLYRVGIVHCDGNIWFANAPTLPRALCEAVARAYEVLEERR